MSAQDIIVSLASCTNDNHVRQVNIIYEGQVLSIIHLKVDAQNKSIEVSRSEFGNLDQPNWSRHWDSHILTDFLLSLVYPLYRQLQNIKSDFSIHIEDLWGWTVERNIVHNAIMQHLQLPDKQHFLSAVLQDVCVPLQSRYTDDWASSSALSLFEYFLHVVAQTLFDTNTSIQYELVGVCDM